MNYRMIGFVLGRILLVEAALMLLPLAVALFYGETTITAFLVPILLLIACGVALNVRQPKQVSLFARDGLAIVALAWVVMSLFGALPLYLSGEFASYVDCFFETVSGFTTTGASILTDVEALSHGVMFWRCFTHWVGGMGVLVFVMAVLPMSDGHGMHLLRAEMPGPAAGKLVSRMSDTAKILYGIYMLMTAIEIFLLVIGGMSLFEAAIHTFSTAGTGGFSNRAQSVGAFNNPYFEIVIGVFMLLFGVNFNLYYFLLIGRFRDVFHSEELRAYFGIVAVSVIALALNLREFYGSFATGVRYAFFQVASVMTTTGFSSADFNLWPSFSKFILIILMFIGGCAGSTAGGIKVSRLVICLKTSLNDMKQMLHPTAVPVVRFEKKPLNERMTRGVMMFLAAFFLVTFLSVLLLSLEGYDLETTATAVIACITNTGPGLSAVGPMGSYAFFTPLGKLLLSFNMLAGRLELFPMLLLLPTLLRRHSAVRRS